MISAILISVVKPLITKVQGLARKSRIAGLYKSLEGLNAERRNLVVAKHTSESEDIDSVVQLIDRKRDALFAELRKQEELAERIGAKQYWPLSKWRKLTLWFTPTNFQGWFLGFSYYFSIAWSISSICMAVADIYQRAGVGYDGYRHVEWKAIIADLVLGSILMAGFLLVACHVQSESIYRRAKSLGGPTERRFIEKRGVLLFLIAALPALPLGVFGAYSAAIFPVGDFTRLGTMDELVFLSWAAMVAWILWIWSAYLRTRWGRKKAAATVASNGSTTF
ncbi:MAG: hypothetical protein M3O31_02025 [Acidobacteriota bacterium]|nr:hypothetical protein [Acidobacteriota bacterium]